MIAFSTPFDDFDGCDYEICINGKKYVAKSGRIDPNKVSFWLPDEEKREGNPRLWNWISNLRKDKTLKGKLTNRKLEKLIYEKESSINKDIMSLVEGLGISGEPAEAIVCDCNLTTIEGFRRVAASRIRKNKNNDSRFNDIPVIILPPSVSEEDLFAYIGLIHISQKKAWKSCDRAAAAAKFRDDFGWEDDRIRQHFSWTKKATEIYLRSYDLFKEYQKETGDYSPKKFTQFYKVASSVKLCNCMFNKEDENYDPELWPQFKNWVKEGRINDCRDVHSLVGNGIEILNSPKAVSILTKIGSTAAIDFIKSNSKDPAIKQLKECTIVLESLDTSAKKKLASKSDAGAKLFRNVLLEAKVAIDALYNDLEV